MLTSRTRKIGTVRQPRVYWHENRLRHGGMGRCGAQKHALHGCRLVQSPQLSEITCRRCLHACCYEEWVIRWSDPPAQPGCAAEHRRLERASHEPEQARDQTYAGRHHRVRCQGRVGAPNGHRAWLKASHHSLLASHTGVGSYSCVGCGFTCACEIGGVAVVTDPSRIREGIVERGRGARNSLSPKQWVESK